jgi:hypothetical protein
MTFMREKILFGFQYINVFLLVLHPSAISLVSEKGKNNKSSPQ